MKILVKHTRIEIHDYQLGDIPGLEKKFLVWDNIAKCFFPKGMEYDNENRILKLPRGYSIQTIENAVGMKAIVDENCDNYEKTSTTMFKFTPRDKTQVKAIQFMVGQGEYTQNKNKSQLFLNLHTGKGKTYCTIYATSYLQLRTIVIASNFEWLKQWKNFILKYTDISNDEIHIMAGESSINRIEKYGVDNIKYLLITHSTIRNYAAKYGWPAVGELFKRLKIGIKVFDEAHLDFDNIINIDYNTNTYKTIYVTATKARSDKSQNIVYKRYFQCIPNISLFNQEEDPHTKYIAIKYDSCPTQKEMMKVMSNPTYGFDRNNYTRYLVNKPHYYRVLLSILKIGMKLNGKVLIYIGTNDAIQKTYNWINNYIPMLRNQVGIYTSIIPEHEKPKMLEKKIILSTTKSCGAASDIEGLKMTVVLAEPFKSEVTTEQTLGRTRDSETYYFDCVDTGFSVTQRYYKSKKEIFSTYATSCVEITLSEEDLYERVEDFSQNFQFIQPNGFLINPIKVIEPENPI